MNILIIGCGKVGSNLAGALSRQGHDVSIIDRDSEYFDSLPKDFNGFTTVGVPIDQDILRKAGIESCDVLCAVTPNDNINIMVSEVAKLIFKVKKVFIRLYDPNLEDFFSEYGVNTVCPTNLTVAAVCNALNEKCQTRNISVGARTINFITMDIPKSLIGLTVSEIEFEEDEVLFAVERDDKLILVGLNDIYLEKEDKLIFSKIVN